MTDMPHMQQIKASAGSGKTHDITGRFLTHISQAALRAHRPSCSLARDTLPHAKIEFGDIMAITFTNAAAAEMKERIMQKLKEIALKKETEYGIDPATARQWIYLILRQYGALNVRTIDSLLHLIVRTAALDLGLPPDFETSFAGEDVLEPIFDDLLAQIWEHTKENAHDSEGQTIEGLLHAVCRSLLFREESTGFASGSRILSALLPLVDLALCHGIPKVSPLANVEAQLTHMYKEYMACAATLLQHIEKAKLAVKAQSLQVFTKCAAGDLKVLGSAWLQKDNIDSCLLKKSQGTAPDDVHYSYARVCQCAADLAGKGHILRKALELAPFVELAQCISTKFEDFTKRERKVSAASIALLAQKILSFEYGVPTALCRLGSSIHHVLLDEFQDTSRAQWNALRPLFAEVLSRGGSLTWVGDVKQAIYGWRGGDAALFDAVCDDKDLTCMAKVTSSTLPTNWRSRERIVHTNNTLFSALANKNTAHAVLDAMTAQDCPEYIICRAAQKAAHVFADTYQEMPPQKKNKDTFGGYVTIQDICAENSSELDSAIQEALHARLVDDLGTRRPWNEITILTRSNTGAAKVASWLMDWDIPAITENSLLLNAHPLIAESLALLAFLDSPQDNLSFWTVLTGTTLAHTENTPRPAMETLQEWALKKHDTFLSTAFKEQWPEFWQEIFAPFYSSAGILSPYNCLQEWYRLRRIAEHFPEAETFLRRFMEIAHTAEERGCHSLSTFLEYWQKNGKEEKAPMPTSIDAVRIMTIHKSKGLQFKVVIIPWMSFSQKDDANPTLYEVDGLHVLAPCSKHMGDVFYEQQAENALEAWNVLYVACTRAEEELHAFHTHTPHLLHMRNLACGLEVLLPTAGFSLPYESGVPIISKESAIEESTKNTHETPNPFTSPQNASNKDIQKNLTSERPMQWLPRLKIYRNPLQDLLPSKPVASNKVPITARKRGIILHHCLEYFFSTGQENAAHDAEHAIQLGLRSLTLPPHLTNAQYTELYESLVRAITWYASLEDVACWKDCLLPEHNILDSAGNMHRIDALLTPQPANNISQTAFGWRALEYKTGKAEDAHIEQLRRYLKLLDALPPLPHATKPLPKSQGMLLYFDLQRCRMVQDNTVSELLMFPQWA